MVDIYIKNKYDFCDIRIIDLNLNYLIGNTMNAGYKLAFDIIPVASTGNIYKIETYMFINSPLNGKYKKIGLVKYDKESKLLIIEDNINENTLSNDYLFKIESLPGTDNKPVKTTIKHDITGNLDYKYVVINNLPKNKAYYTKLTLQDDEENMYWTISKTNI